ncbi:hypothetical protein Pan44_07910 [Caulifigura coniformis]|uniref:Uncharacterized protein n=1 Tax=Caulifigura coniformis TaxID=2527983 RepID=A0A517S9H5_9PLAN|nr:hypothetical protein [Caulifigura coniformis]QDT52779.1 hypothetical protein Pan44_07910 [Caulifigura coniformis]
MGTSDLLSLFGYYMGIIAFLFALFTARIDEWANEVLEFCDDWDPAQQKSNSLVKRQQDRKKKRLLNVAPLFALWAPLGLAALFASLGGYAIYKASNGVNRIEVSLYLILPALVLMVLHFCHGRSTIKESTHELDKLKG